MSSEDLFRRLIAFDTTSTRSNLALSDFLADYLDRPGVRLERFRSPDETRDNLLVSVGPDPDSSGAGLVLSGHMDVVPAGEKGWDSDPFVLTDLDDRWIGRGTADMKGFLAIAIHAASRATDLEQPLVLLLTYDEEVGCLGSRELVEGWPEGRHLPRACIIGEPTSLRVVRMHKGHLKVRITIRGKAAHSGYPHLGENAIERAGEVILALKRLGRELEGERPEHSSHFEVPWAPLNTGTIRGGRAINIVPELCEIEVGVRPLPGMRTSELEDRIRAAVDGDDVETETISASPPMILDPGSRIHQELCSVMGQTGDHSVSFATDGGWLQELGLECAVWGPGSIKVAHKVNEYMPKDEFRRAETLLEQIIGVFCR